jgi:hypothetical protein
MVSRTRLWVCHQGGEGAFGGTKDAVGGSPRKADEHDVQLFIVVCLAVRACLQHGAMSGCTLDGPIAHGAGPYLGDGQVSRLVVSINAQYIVDLLPWSLLVQVVEYATAGCRSWRRHVVPHFATGHSDIASRMPRFHMHGSRWDAAVYNFTRMQCSACIPRGSQPRALTAVATRTAMPTASLHEPR